MEKVGTTPEAAIEQVVERLGGIPGVVGLALGGSRARGVTAADADIDIGIYYRADGAPDSDALRAAARELDDRGQPDGFGDYGEWGPWINGGAWLKVGSHKTDFLFREIERVERVLDDCHAGVVVTAYQPGHPHCFVNQIYAGEVNQNVILFDPEGAMATLRSRTDPYPEPLAIALMRSFGWEAEFALQTAGTAARRRDLAYVTGCLYRSISCMVQALFAANRTYLVNEKGAVGRVEDLDSHPDAFAARLGTLLAVIGSTAEEIEGALAAAFELQRETHRILAGAGAFEEPVSSEKQ
jgi:predicted nucleotidyltransferase